jgi:very-short-patch-repair endonuclease
MTAERVLVDLTPGLTEKRAARCFREAIRLRHTTATKITACVERHGGQPSLLKDLAHRYAPIPYARTRSDAEARALELLHDAGVEPPRVNIKIAGEEADLVWIDRKRIVEIDGPQYHQFRAEDERKAARWREAGFTVRRLPSGAVYDDPDRLIAFSNQ